MTKWVPIKQVQMCYFSFLFTPPVLHRPPEERTKNRHHRHRNPFPCWSWPSRGCQIDVQWKCIRRGVVEGTGGKQEEGWIQLKVKFLPWRQNTGCFESVLQWFYHFNLTGHCITLFSLSTTSTSIIDWQFFYVSSERFNIWAFPQKRVNILTFLQKKVNI